MTMMNSRSQIGKLRVRSKRKDAAACRNSLSSLLSNSSFKPSSILPAEVLIVRKMHDPLPGKLSAKVNRFSPGMEWQAALNKQINDLYFNAVRPQNGIISSESEAVVFSDMAELLACYVSDIVNGRVWQRWWWKTMFKEKPLDTNISQSLIDILIENIEYLPAIFYRLYLCNLLQPVIKTLDKQNALVLSIRLAEEYQLHELLSEIKYKTRLMPDEGAEHKQNNTNQLLNDNNEKAEKSTDSSSMSNAAPIAGDTDRQILKYDHYFKLRSLFSEYLSADSFLSGTGMEQILLTGLSLVLNQKPWQALSGVFQKQLINILESTRFSHKNNTPYAVAEKNSRGNTLNEFDLLHYSEQMSMQSRAETLNSVDSNKSTNDMTALNNAPLASCNEQSNLFSEEGITTDLAGIFYLLNLISWLDLPACFENSQSLVPQPSPWALLEVISRALLGEHINNYQDDEIWLLLRELDGRESTDLININTADDYHLPEQWFNSVYSDRQTWRWSCTGDRLYIWSASGYMLTDVFCNNKNAFQQAKDLLQSYLGHNRSALLTSGKKQTIPIEKSLENNVFLKNSGQYLSCIIPFIRHQLRLACGSEADDLFAQILQCRGRIYATSSHIDLVVPLENISMAARQAGLDRDPGWLVQAGRVVLFHFD